MCRGFDRSSGISSIWAAGKYLAICSLTSIKLPSYGPLSRAAQRNGCRSCRVARRSSFAGIPRMSARKRLPVCERRHRGRYTHCRRNGYQAGSRAPSPRIPERGQPGYLRDLGLGSPAIALPRPPLASPDVWVSKSWIVICRAAGTSRCGGGSFQTHSGLTSLSLCSASTATCMSANSGRYLATGSVTEMKPSQPQSWLRPLRRALTMRPCEISRPVPSGVHSLHPSGPVPRNVQPFHDERSP